MAKIEDCPGFETFGADIKAARKAKHLTRKDLAEKVNIESRYLANIENEGTIPSLPVVIHAVLIFPIRAIEVATAAILRRVRPATVVMIETGLFLHQPFKGPVLAGSKVHSVTSFMNLGIKKAADFFQNLRQDQITERTLL